MHALVKIENFRSIKSTSVRIRHGLNVLVGPNGSGKTNVLSALRLLSGLLTGGASLAMGKAGGAARNFRRGEGVIRFVITSFVDEAIYKGKKSEFYLRWEVQLSLNRENNLIQVRHESVRIRTVRPESVDDVIAVEVNRSSSGAFRSKVHAPDPDCISKRLLSSNYWAAKSQKKADMAKVVGRGLADVAAKAKELPQDASILELISPLHSTIREVYSGFASLEEYNIVPEKARLAADPLPITRMGSDGSSISEVIHALETKQYRRLINQFGYMGNPPYFSGRYMFSYRPMGAWTKDDPLGSIQEHLQAAVSSIDRISTDLDPSTGRRYMVFGSDGMSFRPEEVSDGTIKWVCLLAAIFVPAAKMVLLEEPENFMHPWMQQRFIDLARTNCKKSRASVFLTTHSVTMLNAIVLSELQIVRQEGQETLVDTVADVDAVQRVLDDSNFGLGDIWVSGGIGGVAGGV